MYIEKDRGGMEGGKEGGKAGRSGREEGSKGARRRLISGPSRSYERYVKEGR